MPAGATKAYSIQRLATQLNVSVRTAYRLVAGGDLLAHRVGRQWRIFERGFAEVSCAAGELLNDLKWNGPHAWAEREARKANQDGYDK